MFDRESGITLFKKNEGIEKVSLKGLELTLLASGDGTEIIHHKLWAGSHWALVPADGWNALESFVVLSGTLRWTHPHGRTLLSAGDTISALPIRKETVFAAETDSEFLYISSQPVFHHYSKNIREMMNLAVEIENKDGYTSDHCHRIMKFSMMVGDKMNLNSSELLDLNFGSFLHDVGKIKVPDEVLLKPGKFTDEEWRIMRLHTVYGKQMLDETGLPNLRGAGRIVEQHHERFTGKGYPHQLAGRDILIGAAIVAVVDSYDAMTTDRVYRKGMTKEEAFEEIERCRNDYHPEVVEAFFSLTDRID